MNTELQRLLREAMGDKTDHVIAIEWSDPETQTYVPAHVIRDLRKGVTRLPSAKYLPAIARGLGLTPGEVVNAGYAELTPSS